jgi:hypothetical protein
MMSSGGVVGSWLQRSREEVHSVLSLPRLARGNCLEIGNCAPKKEGVTEVKLLVA